MSSQYKQPPDPITYLASLNDKELLQQIASDPMVIQA